MNDLDQIIAELEKEMSSLIESDARDHREWLVEKERLQRSKSKAENTYKYQIVICAMTLLVYLITYIQSR